MTTTTTDLYEIVEHGTYRAGVHGDAARLTFDHNGTTYDFDRGPLVWTLVQTSTWDNVTPAGIAVDGPLGEALDSVYFAVIA